MSLKLTSNRLLVIGGPTAVGKTAFSIALAKQLSSEIFSADSRQCYRELNIGVARPTQGELQEVKHHFIASHSIHQGLNAGQYEIEGLTALSSYFEKHSVAVLSGGTGLYIKAICEGLDPLPIADQVLRKELQLLFEQEGLSALQARYDSLGDAPKIDRMNPQRLMRAIEIAENRHTAEDQSKPIRSFKPFYFYLNMDRADLYSRINRRVDAMIEEGLVDEAKDLFEHRALNALQTVGYSELFKHFLGEWSLETAIEKIKQHSRNYAKRQITWFKNQGYEEINLSKNQSLEKVLNSIDTD